METQKQEQLNVYMLGGFSVQYLGKEILLGRKNTLKFIQLMQLIWLRGNKEISKKELIDAMYDRRDVADPNNSINNLFIRLKSIFRQQGFRTVITLPVQKEDIWQVQRFR